MKKKALKSLLLTFVLGLAIFGTIFPDPSEPAPAQVPEGMEPPNGGEDTNPLSDLKIEQLD